MKATDRRAIGRTKLSASLLGFGSAPLGDLYTALPDHEALATVEAAVAAGIALFDSSPFYGRGLSEHRLGTVLKRAPRDRITVSTKVGRTYSATPPADPCPPGAFVGGLPFHGRYDYSYDGAMRSFEQSLLRMGLSRLDILLIHDVDIWTHGADMVEQRFAEAMNGAYRALHDLRAQGVIGAIGVGINESDMCARFARAGDFDCILLAGRYTLLEQGALDDFLPLCQQKNIGILLGGVFNSGILARGAQAGAAYNYKPAPPEILARVRRLETVCQAHGVPLAAAAMQFAAAHPVMSSLVIGAVKPQEIAQNVASLEHPVPASLWSDLVTEKLVRPDAPVPGGKGAAA